MTTYKNKHKVRYERMARSFVVIEDLARQAGFSPTGNDKSDIDRFLDLVESGQVVIKVQNAGK